MQASLGPRKARWRGSAPFPNRYPSRAVADDEMGRSHLRLDLALLREGLTIGVEFGLASLEGLARTAEFLEHSVYERGSLARSPDGLEFTLLNPPLRMGSFSEIRVWIDGHPVPPEDGSVAIAPLSAVRKLSSIDVDHPIDLPVGHRARFRVELAPPPEGRTHVRLEFDSVAIPPHVWIAFSETPRRGAA